MLHMRRRAQLKLCSRSMVYPGPRWGTKATYQWATPLLLTHEQEAEIWGSSPESGLPKIHSKGSWGSWEFPWSFHHPFHPSPHPTPPHPQKKNPPKNQINNGTVSTYSRVTCLQACNSGTDVLCKTYMLVPWLWSSGISSFSLLCIVWSKSHLILS